MRHLKIKDGRFCARLTVPAALRHGGGKSELVTPLGGNRREALPKLPEAVAEVQRRLEAGKGQDGVAGVPAVPVTRHLLGAEQLAARSYKDRLQQDTMLRQASQVWADVSVDTDPAFSLRNGLAGRLANPELAELVGGRIDGFRPLGHLAARLSCGGGMPRYLRLRQGL